MKIAIGALLAGAAFALALSFADLIPATSLLPPVLFAVAMILVLLNVIAESDRKY